MALIKEIPAMSDFKGFPAHSDHVSTTLGTGSYHLFRDNVINLPVWTRGIRLLDLSAETIVAAFVPILLTGFGCLSVRHHEIVSILCSRVTFSLPWRASSVLCLQIDIQSSRQSQMWNALVCITEIFSW